MRRRLPLLGVPAAAEPARLRDVRGEPRLELPRGSVGVADTSSGLLAAELAVQLATLLSLEGTPVALVLLGYQGVPVLPPELSRQLAARALPVARGAVVRSLAYAIEAVGEPSEPPDVRAEPGEATLWVGLPALCSFRPQLALLLGADRPLSQWPEALRARRPPCELSLGQNRPGLVASLAGALNEHGFLPRR